ncbi:ABC transporter substrate-binding protein [Aliivibrio wodanis]|uniref:ABC transporter substrate-binding protein n=1 Tax=Aliivibrio wodanis TaxID=80852 RepID=UPI00406C2FCF
MKKSLLLSTATLLGLTFSAFAKEPVKLLLLDWGSQKVLTKALGNLLTQQNIPIEYVYSDENSQWYKLAHGKADVQVEVWEGSMATKFQELIDSGYILDGGTHIATTREEWWYPDYVEKRCPGLPNWAALKECYTIFSEGKERGIYYTGPWEKPDEARIRALELQFDVVKLKNGDEINKKIRKYIADKKPLLIFNWTPNWVEAQYQGKFVAFPEYAKECESKAYWGINPKFMWDCGNPIDGWLKIAISTSLLDKSPCAVDIIHSFSLDNEQVAQAAILIDEKNMSIDKASNVWMEQNKEYVKKWLSHSSCNKEIL